MQMQSIYYFIVGLVGGFILGKFVNLWFIVMFLIAGYALQNKFELTLDLLYKWISIVR